MCRTNQGEHSSVRIYKPGLSCIYNTEQRWPIEIRSQSFTILMSGCRGIVPTWSSLIEVTHWRFVGGSWARSQYQWAYPGLWSQILPALLPQRSRRGKPTKAQFRLKYEGLNNAGQRHSVLEPLFRSTLIDYIWISAELRLYTNNYTVW